MSIFAMTLHNCFSCILLTNFVNLPQYPVHNILRHFHGSADFPFTASETKGDI